MVTTLEAGAPVATYYTETIPEFTDHPGESSAFARGQVRIGSEPQAEPDRAWLRAYIADLLRDVKRLHSDVRRVVRELPRLLDFRHALRELLRGPATRRNERRRAAVQHILASQLPRVYVQEVLRQCARGGGPDGMDIGIDILSQTGALALGFGEEFLREDSPRWSQTPTIAHHPHDDYWDILLRAAARATPERPETLRLIRSCMAAGNRGLRDATALALYDLGTPAARALLAEMAQNDPDALIRRDAQELLEDFGS